MEECERKEQTPTPFAMNKTLSLPPHTLKPSSNKFLNDFCQQLNNISDLECLNELSYGIHRAVRDQLITRDQWNSLTKLVDQKYVSFKPNPDCEPNPLQQTEQIFSIQEQLSAG